MPDGQIVNRRRPLEDGADRQMQDGLHRQGGEHAHQQADDHQDLHRHPHPARRLMGMPGQIDGFAVEEDIMDEA